MISMPALVPAHKKTVVIRPQMHNGLLPTNDIRGISVFKSIGQG